MAKILAFDTSSDAYSAALVLNGSVIDFFELAPRQQASRILVLIGKLLTQAGVKLTQLDAIAFANGPGSFTGIRLAASIAQGLALGANLPVIPISTLCAMAQGAYHDFQADHVLVATDAYSGDIYWGGYQSNDGLMQPICEEQRCKPTQVVVPMVADYVGIGSGWALYKEVLSQLLPQVTTIHALYYPHALNVMKLAEAALANGLFIPPEEVSPFYLHPADTWKKVS